MVMVGNVMICILRICFLKCSPNFSINTFSCEHNREENGLRYAHVGTMMSCKSSLWDEFVLACFAWIAFLIPVLVDVATDAIMMKLDI